MPGAVDYLKGGAGGAGAGAAVGGPIGALVGGGLGLLGTYLGGDSNNQQQTKDLIAQYQARYGQNYNMGPAAQSQTSGFRDQQQGLANRLEAQSMGQGPSLATEQLKSGLDQNMAQQASFAAGGRGGQASVGAFMAANNAARLGAQTDQQAVQARIQEQMNAQQQLGGLLNQGRGSDEANSQFNAQQQNYQSQANQRTQLQAMGMTDDQIAKLLGLQNQQNQQPTFSDQLLAGGAGMYAQSATQNAQSKAAAAARAASGGTGGVGSAGGYAGVRMPDGSLYGGH